MWCVQSGSLLSEVFSIGRQHHPLEHVGGGQGRVVHWQLVTEVHESCAVRSERLSSNLHMLHCFTQHPSTTNKTNGDLKLLLAEQSRNFLYLFPSHSQTEANS